ncbi:hypothetical protein [uncultured Dokdonia sp.]|uniref:hypothetical protein n=1 Tax=uncultured Dokdonia sp. TaxID=575653 RepID=UPI00260F2B4A|nr:hypothetical protein [uncultured Dokdonia sp.]
MKTPKILVMIGIIALVVSSCASLYDHYTYTETIATKVQAISLIEQSDESYALHASEVTALKNQLQIMLAYEEGKAKNDITVRMWRVLNNDEKLIKSYLSLWEEKGTLSPVFIGEAKPQIEEAFDILIAYEEKKDKKTKETITDFIDTLKE